MTDIQEMPLSVPHFRRKVEDFLGRNDLRLEDVDVYLTIQDPEGEILAGGGLKGDVNRDGSVDISDIVAVINIMAGNKEE